MFTGLVREIGIILSVEGTSHSKRIEVEASNRFTSSQTGASICCSGCCLTVTEKSKNSLFFDVSKETLNKTTIGSWIVGTRINLEPSLHFGDEVGGHLVSGHVDAMTEIIDIEKEGDSYRLKIAIPNAHEHFIASKGSVALDGISLTINEVEKTYFGINIIPHTWQVTTIGDRKPGDFMNIEIDMLARYVARMLDTGKGS